MARRLTYSDPSSDQDRDLYIGSWTDTMIRIWMERIERLRIVYTGRLHESFSSSITATAQGSTIEMKFARYGIYQALGVGKGYTKGNPGDLDILNPEYREKHGLNRPRKVGKSIGGYWTSGKPRKRRDWMSKKLYMSIMAMKEDLARITGQEAAGVICDALEDIRSTAG